MLVEYHTTPLMIPRDDCFENMTTEQNVKQSIRVNQTNNKMRLNPDRIYLIKSKIKKVGIMRLVFVLNVVLSSRFREFLSDSSSTSVRVGKRWNAVYFKSNRRGFDNHDKTRSRTLRESDNHS